MGARGRPAGGARARLVMALVALVGASTLSSGLPAGALSVRAGGCGPRAGTRSCAVHSHGASWQGQRIASAARSQVGRGLAYVPDGGGPSGPTGGGFDCTGLALYAIFQATGANGFAAKNAAGWVHGWGFSQWVAGQAGVVPVGPWGGVGDPYPVNAAGRYPALLPGDILVIAGGAHVGIYLGGGTMVQANSQIGVAGQAWYFAPGVGLYSLWHESGTGTYPLTAVYRFTGPASPPPAPTLYRNQVLRVAATGTSYWADARGTIHWIPDALSYDYYVALDGAPVSLTQAQVNRLGSGRPWAPRQVRPVDAANHILVVSATGTAYLADSTGQVHWIPTTSVYGCLVARGYGVLRGIAQAQVNRLGSGRPWATCTTPPPPPPPPAATPASIAIAWSSAHPTWIAMTLTGFGAGTYTYSCDFGSGGNQSYAVSVSGSPETFDNGQTCYDAIPGDTVWVTIGSVMSNVLTVAGAPPPPPPTSAVTYAETVGGSTRTFTDYLDAGGTQGPNIASGQTVQVTCRASGFAVLDGNTWWYRIASSPWSNAYWASADPFYNDGATSGPLSGTPFVDTAVPLC